MGNPESAEPNRFFAQFAALVALVGRAARFRRLVVRVMEPLTNLVPGWPKMAG